MLQKLLKRAKPHPRTHEKIETYLPSQIAPHRQLDAAAEARISIKTRRLRELRRRASAQCTGAQGETETSSA
jgi:hypothetical protein